MLIFALSVCAAAAFAATRALAAANAEIRKQDAGTLYARAQTELGSGDAAAATTSLRAATAKDPANPKYRVALARMLAEAHQDDEARTLLLDLRDAQPEDADTNLELALSKRAVTIRRPLAGSIRAHSRPSGCPIKPNAAARSASS